MNPNPNPYTIQEGLPPASPAGMYPTLHHTPSQGHFNTTVPGSPMASGPVYPQVAQPVPVASPMAVMNPLQAAAPLASPVQLVPATPQHTIQAQTPISMYKAAVPGAAAPRVAFVKHMHMCSCIRVGKHELILSPGTVLADHTGCCCNFERSTMSAKDITSWVTETKSTCGNSFCCCPGRGRVELRANSDTAAIHLRTPTTDTEPYGPIQLALRQTVNADKRAPIVTNDSGSSWTASTCVCFCWQITNKLQLGGSSSYDVIAVRTEEGCFTKKTRADATSAPDVHFTSYTNSMGCCACIPSNLGACHCGEQLVLGTRDKNTLTVATNKGQAKEAVAELYRRSRHPMMPEPVVQRKIQGTTACCGQESELTISSEFLTLSKYRHPLGCFVCSPCQAATNVTINIDDVKSIRVEEESPFANAAQVFRAAPYHFRNLVADLVLLEIFAVLTHLLSLILLLPMGLYEAIVGIICLPCRRAFVLVDGPADLAFRVRPKNDTGLSIADFAVELHTTLRTLKEQRGAQLKNILNGAGKDQVLFTDTNGPSVKVVE